MPTPYRRRSAPRKLYGEVHLRIYGGKDTLFQGVILLALLEELKALGKLLRQRPPSSRVILEMLTKVFNAHLILEVAQRPRRRRALADVHTRHIVGTLYAFVEQSRLRIGSQDVVVNLAHVTGLRHQRVEMLWRLGHLLQEGFGMVGL